MMEEAADEIERLRAEVGRLLDSRDDEAERLDWLLARLPGSVIRDLVGVMSNTRDSGEWRAFHLSQPFAIRSCSAIGMIANNPPTNHLTLRA